MKKISIIFAFALLISLIGCANSFVPNTSDSNEENNEVTSATGIEIELNAPENATRYWIYRKENASDDYKSGYRISGDLPRSKVIDYFVEPNKTYYYKIEYVFPGNQKNKYVELEKKSNDCGIGKLVMPQTSISYNNTTGVMTFSPTPNFSNINSHFNRNVNLSMNYTLETPEGYTEAWSDMNYNYNNKTYSGILDWSTAHANTENKEFYDKKLNLNILDVGLNINNSWYNMRYSDYNTKINTVLVNVPQTIVIPDKRITIPATSTPESKGVTFNMPSQLPTGTKRIDITREELSENQQNTICINNYIQLSADKITDFTDYFVEPGKKYRYEISFINDKYNVIAKAKMIEIEAKSGVGNLTVSPDTKVEYDENTSIMKVSPIPSYPELNEIFTSNDSFSVQLLYSHSGHNIWGKFDATEGTIDWGKTLAAYEWSKDFFYKPLILNSGSLEAVINNVRYQNWYSKDVLVSAIPSIKNFDTIIVKDPRPTLKVKNTNEGIEIKLPENIPEQSRFIIRRRVLGENDWFKDTIEYFNYGKTTIKSVTDYFVQQGKTYEYYLTVKNNNWETIYESKNVSITSTNGLGELSLGNTPSTQYDEATSVLTYNPIPVFTDTINTFIKGNENINKYWTGFRVGYGYTDAEGGGHQYDRVINEDTTSYDYGAEFTVGTNLEFNFDFVEAQVRIGDISYGKYLPTNQFTNFHKKIFVKGTALNK